MFSSASELSKNQLHLSGHVGRSVSSSYDSYPTVNFGGGVGKPAQSYGNYRSWASFGGRFGAEMEDESGVSTPPLWRSSPPASPQHRPNNYRCLSPSSKAQAIARGQKELMDMVSRMPESCYELSLKDLVEHPLAELKQESFPGQKGVVNRETHKREKGKKKKKNEVGKINRNQSFENGGHLLKVVFPVSLGSKQKKKYDSMATNNSKVSPRPSISDASVKGVDKEWWKKGFSASTESESGRSSAQSGSTRRSGSSSSRSSMSNSIRSDSSRSNSSRHKNNGCWSFILGHRPKALE